MVRARWSSSRRQWSQQHVGLSLRSQTSKREMPIGPMEDVKGAENNLGLDDIPQAVEWIVVGCRWQTKFVGGH
jgi:hypothetical protein